MRRQTQYFKPTPAEPTGERVVMVRTMADKMKGEITANPTRRIETLEEYLVILLENIDEEQ